MRRLLPPKATPADILEQLEDDAKLVPIIRLTRAATAKPMGLRQVAAQSLARFKLNRREAIQACGVQGTSSDKNSDPVREPLWQRFETIWNGV